VNKPVSRPKYRTSEEFLAANALIDEAIRRATREAVLTHARLGRLASTVRDGKVVWLQPEEIFALFAAEPGQPPAA